MANRLTRKLSRGSEPVPASSRVANSEEIAGLRAVSDAVIYPHVFENADREVGGVLIGRGAAAGGLPLVTGAIPAISAEERRATLTFTQEAWAHVHRVLETQFPAGEEIVGWYHSHPGFGIFLSGHDLFIHENFFNGPSQIAVVVDPRGKTEGAFVWRDGKLVALFERPTPAGWVAPKTAHAGPGDRQVGATPPSALPRTDPGFPLLAMFISGLIGVGVGFGVWDVAKSGPAAPKPAPAAIGKKPAAAIAEPTSAPRESSAGTGEASAATREASAATGESSAATGEASPATGEASASTSPASTGRTGCEHVVGGGAAPETIVPGRRCRP